MKVVVVSQRVDAFPDRDEMRDALDQRLGAFLIAAGYLPVPVPNVFFLGPKDDARSRRGLDAWLSAIAPHGLVLSGGNDIGAHPERDSTELALLDHANNLGLAAVGICRGMQLMGSWAGVGLRSVANHVHTRHRIDGAITRVVNSYHTLGLAAQPADFLTLAEADDGEIEAIGHRRLPWEGWMWHPERERPFDERDVLRLMTLFDG